jgi:hypothetical protein
LSTSSSWIIGACACIRHIHRDEHQSPQWRDKIKPPHAPTRSSIASGSEAPLSAVEHMQSSSLHSMRNAVNTSCGTQVSMAGAFQKSSGKNSSRHLCPTLTFT